MIRYFNAYLSTSSSHTYAASHELHAVTDPYVQVLLFPVLLPASPGVWPQAVVIVPVRFLTRFRATRSFSSTPRMHSPFPFVSYIRSLLFSIPLHLMLNLLGPEAAQEEVG